MNAARTFLAVDGGGTRTRALLIDESGAGLGSGAAGSTNRNHHSRDTVRANLRAAFLAAARDAPDALPRLAGATLGMCGVSNAEGAADIVGLVREIPEVPAAAAVAVINDVLAGLAGGLSGRPGIALIAGTGSACYGFNAQGDSWWAGGWGALADDAGSGHWIGLRAMQAAIRSEDGRLPATLLRPIVFDFLGLKQPREFLDRVHNQGLSREEIASLAPQVMEASRRGDAVARGILEDAAGELAAEVAAVARRVFGDGACEAIFIGGVALSGPPFTPALVARIGRAAPGVRVVEPEMTPVQGAALEALRAAGIAWTPEVLANLAQAGKRLPS